MERNITLTQAQRELIEKFGVHMERSGMSPAEARIIALLAISNITELTFEEIYQVLQISKGAASNAINRLMNVGRIEYITKPGDRKRYFRLELTNWEKNMQEKFCSLSDIGLLWKEILDQRPASTAEFNRGLERMVSFLNFIRVELPQLFEKWQRENP